MHPVVVGGWSTLPCDLLLSLLALADLRQLASMLAVCTEWHRAAAHPRGRRRELTATIRSDSLLASMRAVGISAHPTRSLLAGQVTALCRLEIHFQRRESRRSAVDPAVVDHLIELLPSTVPHLRTLHLHSMPPSACLAPLLEYPSALDGGLEQLHLEDIQVGEPTWPEDVDSIRALSHRLRVLIVECYQETEEDDLACLADVETYFADGSPTLLYAPGDNWRNSSAGSSDLHLALRKAPMLTSLGEEADHAISCDFHLLPKFTRLTTIELAVTAKQRGQSTEYDQPQELVAILEQCPSLTSVSIRSGRQPEYNDRPDTDDEEEDADQVERVRDAIARAMPHLSM